MTMPFQIISATIRAVPSVVSLLKPETLEALKTAAGYDATRGIFRAAVWGSVFAAFHKGDESQTVGRMTVALSRAYIETLDMAYQDGGGELPVDADTAAWARGVLDAQFGYIEQLFADLKKIVKEGNTDPTDYANARADSYASALDGFYAETKMRGSKNIMLTWHLGATEVHCKTCASLDGKSHKIQWYLDRDYIPRKPNAGMECGGWNCDCTLTDKNGNEYTV